MGFYELLRKILEHTEKNYSIITAIWKVFSILLEYCCQTDYRTLIQEIERKHNAAVEKREAEFIQKFNDQATNEKILKDN